MFLIQNRRKYLLSICVQKQPLNSAFTLQIVTSNSICLNATHSHTDSTRNRIGNKVVAHEKLVEKKSGKVYRKLHI